jgi:hypothetical protein
MWGEVMAVRGVVMSKQLQLKKHIAMVVYLFTKKDATHISPGVASR